MTKDDKMILMVIAAVAVVLYVMHRNATSVSVSPALSPPVPVPPNAGLLPASTNPNNLLSVVTPEEAQLIPSEPSDMIGVGGMTEF